MNQPSGFEVKLAAMSVCVYWPCVCVCVLVLVHNKRVHLIWCLLQQFAQTIPLLAPLADGRSADR